MRLTTLTKYVLINAYFRLVILAIPFSRYKRDLEEGVGRGAPRGLARWVGDCVYEASGYFPPATCLSRAMAAQFILSRKGYASKIQVGVARDRNKIIAHAWLITGNYVVVGNEHNELSRYRLITEFKAPNS
jgi:hypothetical protein